MTLRAGTAPSRAPVVCPGPAALRVLGLALFHLRGLFRVRLPSACHLSDRQLADIGLMRADLPDGRGWRR